MNASTSYRPRRLWLPLGVSIGLHGLLFLGLSLLPSREPLRAEVFYPAGGFVMLDDEPAAGPTRLPSAAYAVAEIGSDEIIGRVSEAPVVSPISGGHKDGIPRQEVSAEAEGSGNRKHRSFNQDQARITGSGCFQGQKRFAVSSM